MLISLALVGSYPLWGLRHQYPLTKGWETTPQVTGSAEGPFNSEQDSYEKPLLSLVHGAVYSG